MIFGTVIISEARDPHLISNPVCLDGATFLYGNMNVLLVQNATTKRMLCCAYCMSVNSTVASWPQPPSPPLPDAPLVARFILL